MSGGWTIRPATQEDAKILGHLHVQGWRDSYGGIVDQTYLDGLDEDQRAARWTEMLADGKSHISLAFSTLGEPAGFVSYGRIRTPLPGQSAIRPLYSGEIYAIYILAAFWRQGLGRQLMLEAVRGLAGMKHRSLCLWVLEKNQRAIEFYQALGGQRCGKTMIEIGGGQHKEICFGWRDTAKI